MPVTGLEFLDRYFDRLAPLSLHCGIVGGALLRFLLFIADLGEAERAADRAEGALRCVEPAVDLFGRLHDVTDDIRHRQIRPLWWLTERYIAPRCRTDLHIKPRHGGGTTYITGRPPEATLVTGVPLPLAASETAMPDLNVAAVLSTTGRPPDATVTTGKAT